MADEDELSIGSDRYGNRVTLPPSAIRCLAEQVSLDTNGVTLVHVQPSSQGSGAGTSVVDTMVTQDPLNLGLFGFGGDYSIPYRVFDPRVDRLALADLTNRLVGLLPHYYFFVLPLGIADALHAAGDYERAKRHYDLVLDLFPEETRHIDDRTFADAEPEHYAYLHATEVNMLRSRHAANYLAAGEAAFSRDDAFSRQAAYEHFTRVLLSYKRTRCCEGWGGEVACIPGTPPPTLGRPTAPAAPEEPDRETPDRKVPVREETAPPSSCEETAKQLERLAFLLDPVEEQLLLGALHAHLPERGVELDCDSVKALHARYAKAIEQGRRQLISKPGSMAHVPGPDEELPELVNLYEREGMNAVRSFGGYAARLQALGHRKSLSAGRMSALLSAKGVACAPSGCASAKDGALLSDLRRVFAVPQNPLTAFHLARACLYLDLLERGLNVLGLRPDAVSAYRYEHLAGLARAFANFAVTAE